jgi:hypothetical protein
VLEQTTRDSENSREWGGLQEKAQRKTRMIYGDKVMEPRKQNRQNSEIE